MIDTKFIPRPRTDIVTQKVDDESLILDKSGGLIHQLNATASFIWEHCDGNNSIEEISNILVHNYSTVEENVLNDVLNTILSFKEKNLFQ